ncbi:MAG: heme exporter protein CcmB [Polyangiaceae bacterium]
MIGTHTDTPPRPSPARPDAAGRFLAAVRVVAEKDLTIELRTREIVTTAGFFAILVALMTSISFYSSALTSKYFAPGTVWLSVAFSSILALGRTWQREREDGALTGLLVTPAPRASIFLGKAIGVFVFVSVVEVLVVPVVALVFHVDVQPMLGPLALLLALGTIGVSAMGTLFGAMTVRTRARDLVLATVLFPLLSPMLLSGVAATRELFGGARLADVSDYVLLLAVFDVVAVAGGIGLFGALVDD